MYFEHYFLYCYTISLIRIKGGYDHFWRWSSFWYLLSTLSGSVVPLTGNDAFVNESSTRSLFWTTTFIFVPSNLIRNKSDSLSNKFSIQTWEEKIWIYLSKTSASSSSRLVLPQTRSQYLKNSKTIFSCGSNWTFSTLIFTRGTVNFGKRHLQYFYNLTIGK